MTRSRYIAALVAQSPLASEAAKLSLAEIAAEAREQASRLHKTSSRSRTVDHERAESAAHNQERKALEALKLTSKLAEDDDDL